MGQLYCQASKSRVRFQIFNRIRWAPYHSPRRNDLRIVAPWGACLQPGMSSAGSHSSLERQAPNFEAQCRANETLGRHDWDLRCHLNPDAPKSDALCREAVKSACRRLPKKSPYNQVELGAPLQIQRAKTRGTLRERENANTTPKRRQKAPKSNQQTHRE